MTNQSTDDDCIVFGTARYSLLLPCALGFPCSPIGTCGSKSNRQPLYGLGSFRLSETGMPCTKGFFFAQVLCQFLKYMTNSTSNKAVLNTIAVPNTMQSSSVD